jgi:hypothetical protein
VQQYQQVKLQDVVKQKAMVKEYPVKQPSMRARSVDGKAWEMPEEQVHDAVWVCHPPRQ